MPRDPTDPLPNAVTLLASEPEPVGAYQAKTHLASLLDRVATGQRFVITRHGQAVAMLSPVEQQTDTLAVIQDLQDLADSVSSNGLDVRAAIDEGRA